MPGESVPGEIGKVFVDLDLREFALEYAKRFIGDFYRWGGSNPAGFDCSGFACEYLQAVGLIHRKEDLTARQLFERFKEVTDPYAGCLVFYYDGIDTQNIIHVELCLDSRLSMGASGGGSKTLTTEDAMRDNAFIKVRPFRSRAFIRGFVDPFLSSPGGVA